MKATLDDDRLV